MSSCDVCIGDGNDSDYDVQFYNEKEHRARKPYKCYECREAIAVGSWYVRITGKWDGDLLTFHFCVTCHEIQQVFSCGNGTEFGTLWEQMDYIMSEMKTSSPCFRQLTPEARLVVVDRWWQWKERNK